MVIFVSRSLKGVCESVSFSSLSPLLTIVWISLIHRLFLYLTIRQWDEEDGDSGEEFLYFCSLSDDKVLR